MGPAPIAHPSNVQRWRRLLFVHWRWPLEDLRPHVPSVFQIDTFEGQAYVGLVAFEFNELRAPIGPAGLQLHFMETNVRTYIRSADGASGVYFFSLDAASWLAVIGARIGVTTVLASLGSAAYSFAMTYPPCLRFQTFRHSEGTSLSHEFPQELILARPTALKGSS